MPVNQESMSRVPRPSELDGSDGPPVSIPKTQAEYVQDAIAHVGAARAALRNMTGATLENVFSDPNVDPAYIGCFRELLRLGGTTDSRRKGIVGHPAESSTQSAKEHAPPIISPTPTTRSLPKSSGSSYGFTIHFLPQGEPNASDHRHAREVSRLLALMIPKSVSGPGGTRDLYFIGGSWTPRGDLTVWMCADFRLPDDPLSIINFPGWLQSLLQLPLPPTVCYRRQGTTQYFLRIHDISQYIALMGDWTLIRAGFPTDSRASPNAEYRVSPGFHIRGESVAVADGAWDAYVDISELDEEGIQRFRGACQKRLRFASMAMKKKIGWIGEFHSVSFLELKDES